MNIATLVLASLALTRAAWPRAPKQLWLVAIAAAILPEIDQTSAWFGASAYFRWHHTYTHSLLACVLLAMLFALAYGKFSPLTLREKFSSTFMFSLAFAVSILHVLLDVCGIEGASLLWPFASRRFALDWSPQVDPVVIAVLLAALLLPELLHLVSSEIGARNKKPRGRVGAIIGLALLFVYVAVRAYEHSDVVALLESRTYASEFPRHVGAFPIGLSPFTWFGIVETDRSLHLMDVSVGPTPSFEPENAAAIFKPEISPTIQAAQASPAAKQFVAATQFPAATVEPTQSGATVTFRDLRYDRKGASRDREVRALIRLDTANRILSQHLVWASAGSDE